MSGYDAAIIGGGLAGCSAAIRLAEQGARVVLFESKSYPHHKVCGEFLSPECGDLLYALGVMPPLLTLRPPALTTVRITTPAGVAWTGTFDRDGFGLTRAALDNLLMCRARALGVDVREKTTVQAINGTLPTGFCLNIAQAPPVAARVVIGAHGKRSRVDHTLKRGQFVGLKAHFRGPALGSRVDIHAFPGGYCGLSAVEGGLVNVCLLVRQSVFQRAGSLEAFIMWMAVQNPALGDWFTHATLISPRWLAISQVSFSRKPPVERDIFMAGDSATLIAPLAGSGMAMALRSGHMAAQHAAAFLAGRVSACAALESYAADWQAAFTERLRLAGGLQTVLLRPTLLTPGLRMLNIMPALGQFFIQHTREGLSS